MSENECNILNNMNKAEFREFRSLMIEMVLHTGKEMVSGGKILPKLKKNLKFPPGTVSHRDSDPCKG